jgi:hypothetical protein
MLSAIGALYFPERGVTELVVYHNAHASIPLCPEVLRRYGIWQYRLGRAGNNNGISQWEKIRAG